MPTPPHLPTLDDVARAAGVSTATVSRCLNLPNSVAAKTRDKVNKAVAELGYTPHFAARAMAAKRTYTIGAIIPTMDNAIFARGLQAFQERLHAAGYTLLVASYAYQPRLEEEQIRALVARGADGLLLIGYERDAAIYDFLDRRGVPALVAWAHAAEGTQSAIGFDNRAAMAALTAQVLERGHRRIAMISGVVAGNDRAGNRVEGVRQGMRVAGLDPDALRVIETPYEIENGATAFATLITEEPRPTAVMCGNDVLAVGALQRAREMGLSVPEDVSITGFDDIELARIASPPLTTVHVPHRQMGREAAEALIAMVEKKSAGVSVALESTVMLRESLGPPPLET